MKKYKKMVNPSTIKEGELRNLSLSLRNYILPRLKAYKKVARYFAPDECEDEEQWKKILKEIIWAFEYMDKEQDGDQIEEKRYKKAMELFAKYFDCLWF